MPQLPVAPLHLPADLAHESNGEISQTLLTLCGIANFRMHHLASRALRALMAAYPPLTENASGTYRTLAQQVLLFEARYQTSPIPGRPTKVWNGVTWWQKPNTAMAAVPGTSNHGLGLAIDFSTDMDGYNAFVAWLIVNAIRFGYSAETQSESWHWRYVAGDDVPQAVLDFEGATPEPPDEESDMSKRIQVPGDAAVFKLDGNVCTWIADTAVSDALIKAGLYPGADETISVDRVGLKAYELHGPLPTNNVTKASDFAKWTP